MENITVRDVGKAGPYPLRVEIEESGPGNRGWLWAPESATGDIRAWFYSQCGYTELHTGNLASLRNLYRRFNPGQE